MNCAASVELEEGKPDIDTYWGKLGTVAHECLEAELNGVPWPEHFEVDETMTGYVEWAAAKVRRILKEAGPGARMYVEKRAWAMFIHPEMFGTCDVIIVSPFWRRLYIIDFKYGESHIVKADRNTQLIQYALSVAESYDWNFAEVQLWILQPRATKQGYDYARMPMTELRNYWLPLWHKAVARVERGGTKPIPGAWCHWCKARLECPAKQENRVKEITNAFKTPIERTS